MTAIRVIEEVSRIDAFAGWNLFLSGTAINFFLWIPEEGIEEFFAGGPDTLASGAVNSPGKAILADGGYRMTGRWPFAPPATAPIGCSILPFCSMATSRTAGRTAIRFSASSRFRRH